MKGSSLSGRIWVVTDENGHLIKNIDTDQIYHNAHLHITDKAEMGKYAFGNLEGWRDFPEKSRRGDILVVGRNFGAGSSRQQAVDCFSSLKIGAIIAPSFGAIYFRNAVNSGFPVLRCPAIPGLVGQGKLATGDRIQVSFVSGEGAIPVKNESFSLLPMSHVQHAIYSAGGLYNYGKTWNQV
jgi:3-isopropylmalate/(R)-2-methylmalate dehydratase small subunit